MADALRLKANGVRVPLLQYICRSLPFPEAENVKRWELNFLYVIKRFREGAGGKRWKYNLPGSVLVSGTVTGGVAFD